MVPEAEFTSYYGKPVINRPVWKSPNIPGYLFLGGLAGAASLLGAGAHLTGRPALATAAKAGSFGAGCLSLVATGISARSTRRIAAAPRPSR